MATIVTANNGWVIRPMIESDFTFWMECWKDYPLSPGEATFTYSDRLTWFSARILNNETGTDASIKSGFTMTHNVPIIRTYVTVKPDGTSVGMRVYSFEESGEAWIRSDMIHPTHRGNGHYTDHVLMQLGLMREWNITTTKAWVENDPVFSTWGFVKTKHTNLGMSVSDNARDSSDSALDSGGTAVSLDHWIRARAEFEAQKSGDSDWADVTYVIS
jgi:hypothetical protein